MSSLSFFETFCNDNLFSAWIKEEIHKHHNPNKNDDPDVKFLREVIVVYTYLVDHRLFSNNTVGLGSSLVITELHPNNRLETYTFPIMCQGVDKSDGGKDACNTAEKIIDFINKNFGDKAKE